MMVVQRLREFVGSCVMRIKAVHAVSCRLPLTGRASPFLVLPLLVVLLRFYIALFSALEQTHCVHVPCNSESETVFSV